jgi:hypothetical protein
MNTKIQTYLIVVIFSALMLYGTSTFSVPLMVFLVVVFPLVRLFLSFKVMVVLPVVLLASRLAIPGGILGANLSLFNLATIVSLIAIILHRLAKKEAIVRFDNGSRMALFFVLWTVVLMIVRGSGMRIFGGTQYGGAPYVHIISAFLYFILVKNEVLTLRDIKLTGICMGLIPIISVAGQAIVVLSGGRVTFPLWIVLLGGGALHELRAIRMGLATRLTFLAGLGQIAWLAIFGLKQILFLRIPQSFYVIVALAASALAGYRSVLLLYLCWFGFYGFYCVKRKILYAVSLVMGGGASVLLLKIVHHHLPYGIMRALSFLPGFEHSLDAVSSAAETTSWRLAIWNRVLEDIPRYWLMGRGITYDYRGMASLQYEGFNNPEYAYITGNFHQAFLEVLVLYGAPALLSIILLFSYFVVTKFIPLLREKDLRKPAVIWKMGLASYAMAYFIVWFALGQSREVLVSLPVYLAFFCIMENAEISDASRSIQA